MYGRTYLTTLGTFGHPTAKGHQVIRVAIDSDTLSALTGHAEIIMTYSDLVTDEAAFRALYPHSTVLFIDRGLGDPGNKASIVDYEPGTVTLAQLHDKIVAMNERGEKFPTAYHDRADSADVHAALEGVHHYNGVATLDGTVFVPGDKPLFEPAFVQILPAGKVGIHADLSLVLMDSWNPTVPGVNTRVIARDVNQLISQAAQLSSGLHSLAQLVSG